MKKVSTFCWLVHLVIWFGHIENLWYQMPRKLGKFGQKMHKNLYMHNLFYFWNYIAKNIFFTANIGRGEAQTFHIPKWISCEGSVAFTQNIPQGSEVYRPASGCMKPCRNGVINKKETVRMLFLEYPECSTCQRAKKWLDEHQISYEDRHFMENNPTFE